MFVIVNPKPYDSRPAGSWYVSRSGSAASYTSRLQHARLFSTRDEALREMCSNEYILSIEEALR